MDGVAIGLLQFLVPGQFRYLAGIVIVEAEADDFQQLLAGIFESWLGL